MKVVFLRDIPPHVKRGQVKNVADGYARNYLLPRNLAAPFTKKVETQIEFEKEKKAKSAKDNQKNAVNMFDTLNGKRIVLVVNASDDGTLYAGVGKKEIIQKINADYEITLAENQVLLDKPIKTVGDHKITIQVEPKKQLMVSLNIKKE